MTVASHMAAAIEMAQQLRGSLGGLLVTRRAAANLIVSQAADLSRLREERDALREVSGVEYCTVHDGIQIEWNTDDCDQADTDPDAECHMVALFHALPPVAPSPDPNGGEQ